MKKMEKNGLVEKHFINLITQSGWHHHSGINIDTARSHKKHFYSGKIHERTMVYLLWKAGYFSGPKIPKKKHADLKSVDMLPGVGKRDLSEIYPARIAGVPKSKKK